jgi:hypothetical protein
LSLPLFVGLIVSDDDDDNDDDDDEYMYIGCLSV